MASKRNGRGHNAKGRRIGEGQYVALPHFTLRHEAWRQLSGNAIKVYLELHSRFNGANNGKLSLSLNQGARLLHIGKSTVQRALQELETKGFIVKTRQGQWYGRMATEWRLTSKPYNGHVPTNDWQKWRTSEQPKNNPRSRSGLYPNSDGTASVPKNENMSRISTRQR